MQTSSAVVVDASLVLSLVLGHPSSQEILSLWKNWVMNGVEIAAPPLFLIEATSALHKVLGLRQVSEAVAQAAVEAVIALDVRVIDIDAQLCRSAFDWATRLGQVAAYDAFYVAVAERMNAHLWTADKRLANSASQIDLNWVHLAKGL